MQYILGTDNWIAIGQSLTDYLLTVNECFVSWAFEVTYKVMRVGSIMSSATLIESTILLNDRHPILSIFLLLAHFRNQKHHGQINFILMNFFRILCIVTYQLWPLQLWRLLEAQNHLANTNFGT